MERSPPDIILNSSQTCPPHVSINMPQPHFSERRPLPHTVIRAKNMLMICANVWLYGLERRRGFPACARRLSHIWTFLCVPVATRYATFVQTGLKPRRQIIEAPPGICTPLCPRGADCLTPFVWIFHFIFKVTFDQRTKIQRGKVQEELSDLFDFYE